MASMIPMKEFADRRRKLMDRMAPDSIAILPAAPERVRNRDVLHPFRQDSDFQYLTGFGEPEAVLVLIPGREHGETVLFCKERNPEKELWDGFLVGPEGAIERYGLVKLVPHPEEPERLIRLEFSSGFVAVISALTLVNWA